METWWTSFIDFFYVIKTQDRNIFETMKIENF
jgi:hypothetical protein